MMSHSEDPWLDEFVERHIRRKKEQAFIWNKIQIRERLRTILDQIDQLKKTITEIEQTHQANPVEALKLLEDAEKQKASLSSLFAVFRNDEALSRLKYRMAKTKRNKRWIKKKKEALKAKKAELKRKEQWIDEWRAKRMAEDAERRRREEEREVERLCLKVERRERKKALKTAELAAKLELLLQLRRQRTSNTPTPASEYYEQVLVELSTTGQPAPETATSVTSSKEETSTKIEQTTAQTQETESDRQQRELQMKLRQEEEKMDIYERYYMQGNTNRQSLIQIRREWDMFLTDGSRGSHIPSGFIRPPLPSSPEWARYLVKRKRKAETIL